MTCDFLIQLYNICWSFDLYSRQFTLCYCPVNVYVTSQLRHSLVVHPRVHPLPRKIRSHKKGIYACSRAGSVSCLKCLQALAILPASRTNWLQILKTTENKWINIDYNCLFLTCAHDRNEGNTHNHEHAAILPTDAFKLQISTQKGALQVVLFLERQGKN